MASQDLTPEALEGFAAQLDGKPAHEACPHYTSSPAGMAWLVGAWLQKTGRLAPRDVRMSRLHGPRWRHARFGRGRRRLGSCPVKKNPP